LGVRARVFGTERAVLVGIEDGEQEEASFGELESLADTAGIEVLGTVVQRRSRPHPATYIGRGKVDELGSAVSELDADVVIFNEELTPAQARNLESILQQKVVDRTQLIMDIFAQRAATKEARLQVELAQLHYLLPRLRGWGTSLTRAGGRAVGGVGTRGPGETQLELDRTKIYRRIHTLERRLRKTSRERAVRRQRRGQALIPQVALVGYTNSGKSTLLNRLCETGVLVEDKLFATLDPRVRRTEIVPGREVLLSDTVGFIQQLPHDLVPAFASTLEAVRTADLLLHVVDLSKDNWREDARAVLEILESEVFHDGASRPPMLTVLNKVDMCPDLTSIDVEGIAISARTGAHMDALREAVCERLFPESRRVEFHLPHQAVYALYPFQAAKRATVTRYDDRGAFISADLTEGEWRTLRALGATPIASDASPDATQ
jgi:GTPase